MRAPAELEMVDLRVIRQSMRCFWCGALGLIPGAGLGLAGISLREFRQIARASGDALPEPGFSLWLFAAALAANPMLQVAIGWPAAVVLVCAMLAVHWARFVAHFSRAESAKWNPARAWAWCGAALGSTGIFLSLALLEIFYASTFDQNLLGTR